MKRFHLMEKIEEAKMHNNDIFFLKRLFSKSGCITPDHFEYYEYHNEEWWWWGNFLFWKFIFHVKTIIHISSHIVIMSISSDCLENEAQGYRSIRFSNSIEKVLLEQHSQQQNWDKYKNQCCMRHERLIKSLNHLKT